MNKESRLSFRISDRLNDEIEKMVIIKRDVRDRSDLGNQAMQFYLDLLEGKKIEEQMFLNAIIQIAEKMGKSDIPEVKIIQEKLDWFNEMTKNPLDSAKVLQ